jgi:hypothetical protein
MRNPVITLANDTHHDTSVVSLIFEKDFSLSCQQCSGHESSKTTEIYNPLPMLLLQKSKAH